MFAGKVSWGLSDSLLLFGMLLLAATLLQLSPMPFVSLAVSFVILASYYIGKDIRTQHTEYQSIMDFEKTDRTLSGAFNLTLAGILVFGIFNVLSTYFSASSAYSLMNSTQFISVWVQAGTLYHLKFWFDFVFLVIFVKEFLVLLFKDIINLKLPKAVEKGRQNSHHKREITFIPEQEKEGLKIKKVGS